MNKKLIKKAVLILGSLACFGGVTAVLAANAAVSGGISSIASNVTANMAGVAKLITAGSYVAGMGFAVGAVVKFKAHKDNPTQVTIGMPITLLFVAAALMFIPGVFKTSGATLFGSGAYVAGTSGISSFGATKQTNGG